MTDPSHPKQNSGQALGVTVRLKPAGPADQPVLVNYTHVGLGEGLAYLDFGFLEPALLGAVVIMLIRRTVLETAPRRGAS